jgi:hypothetical protein
VCFWIAINVETVLTDGRPSLERAGFRLPSRGRGPADDAVAETR